MAWTTRITDVAFSSYLRSDQKFVLNVNGTKILQPVPTEQDKDSYEGPTIR
ncbi:hypothetical protein LCGC14_2607060, partial [marine sediment metagenome]